MLLDFADHVPAGQVGHDAIRSAALPDLAAGGATGMRRESQTKAGNGYLARHRSGREGEHLRGNDPADQARRKAGRAHHECHQADNFLLILCQGSQHRRIDRHLPRRRLQHSRLGPGREEIAKWLNSIGVNGIILKYRVPKRPDEPRYVPPLQDAQRAVSLVRSHAQEWNLDPHRIGMLGFSAGGHLTAAASTNFDKRAYETIDAVDQVSCRPDFAVLIYPAYLTGEDNKGLCAEIRVSRPNATDVSGSDRRRSGQGGMQRQHVHGSQAGESARRAACLHNGWTWLWTAAQRSSRERMAPALCRLVEESGTTG